MLNSAASWPEPMAVLLMIVLSFLSAVVCYREYLHIGVGVLPAFLNEPAKSYLGWFLEICMLATNVFMLVWGIKLVADDLVPDHSGFPVVCVGLTYMPIPIGGALTALLVIERFHDAKVLRGAGCRDRQPADDRIASRVAPWTSLILIGSFTVVCLMGMPVAYALGIAAILGAL